MAEEFQLGRGNWWESSSSSSTTSSSTRNKFDSGIISSSNIASNFDNWPTEVVDIKARSSLNLGSVSDGGSMIFPVDSQKIETSEDGGVGRGVLSADPNLQMMGLGLPSQGLDWNQPFFRGEKSRSGFHSILQEGSSSDTNYQQEGTTCQVQDHNWTQKIFPPGNSDDSSVGDYKQQMISPHMTPNLESAPYGSPSNMLQGLLLNDSQQESNFSNPRSLYYPTYNSPDVIPTSSTSTSSWSKFPQFLRTSPPKQQPWPLQPPPPHGGSSSSSHFSGTPFWNSTTGAPAMDDVRSSFIPSLHPQLITNQPVDEKPKEVRDTSKIAKKSGSETSNKRPRGNEAPPPMPAFKVRKEKMGDRITALQQLVSPFGKTDTASVLSEAIDYIKFLHQQVDVLSTPYMKSGGSMQYQQVGDKSNNPEGAKKDLRSRGLCLVPISSTFPVTHETTVDFWTPTFGGTFR